MIREHLGGLVAAPATGGSVGPAAYHTTLYSPVGLWQFNGNKNDDSGNTLHLSLGVGTESYALVGSTRLKGAYFDGATYFSHAYTALLKILTDLTVEMILVLPVPMAAAAYWLMNVGGAGESEAENLMYSVFIDANQAWGYFCEYGAGTNNVWECTYAMPVGVPVHLAMTRSAGQVVKFYMNGVPFATSPVQNAPTGGTASPLIVGANNAGATFAPAGTVIASLKICASELTAAQILGEYQATIGQGQ